MYKWIKNVISKLKAENLVDAAPARASHSKKTKTGKPEPQGKEVPSSQLVSQRSQTKVALLIGLDFGTHSTKVVVRRRGERQGRVISLDRPEDGYPPFAAPSLVRISDGMMWFGKEALSGQGGSLHRLLKLELIKARPVTTTERSTTDLLVTAYFAWMLNKVRNWIEEEYGLNNSKLFLNVAAPMDHFEDVQIKNRYLKILGTAWEWTFGSERRPVCQSIRLDDVKGWVAASDFPIPDATIRPYDVLPETIAPIVSLSQDPRMTAGMYLLIDMGAGTTELSVNFVSVPGGNQNVLCYFDRSIQLGAERFLNGESRNELTSILLRNVWQTWCHGYEKDAHNHAARQRWKSLSILLLGGGTCREDVCGAINAEHHAVYTRFPGDATCQILRHGPANLEFAGLEVSPEDVSLISVANGLAFHRMQWPTFYEPAAVQPIGSTDVQATPDPWYLDR